MAKTAADAWQSAAAGGSLLIAVIQTAGFLKLGGTTFVQGSSMWGDWPPSKRPARRAPLAICGIEPIALGQFLNGVAFETLALQTRSGIQMS